MKKGLEISWFNTSVQKIMITCFTVPKIWCVTDIIVIFHFELYISLLPPLTAQKWKFQKNEKTNKLGDTFILHKRAKNHDHMLYCSLDLACDGCNCYFFWGGSYYLPFYPPNSPKNENFKQMKKKPWRYHHFTQVYQEVWSYSLLFSRYGTWQM